MPTEKQFQSAVVQLAKANGFMVYHTHDSRKSEPGFPDLVLCRNGRIIFAELKSESGKLTDAQIKWRDMLSTACGKNVQVATWWPKDWPEIELILSRRLSL